MLEVTQLVLLDKDTSPMAMHCDVSAISAPPKRAVGRGKGVARIKG